MTTTTPGTTSTSEPATKAAAAKDQATQVASAATDAAGGVASTAKEQAGQIASEAVTQAQNLLSQAGEQMSTQATEQTQRLAGNLRQLGEQLQSMASSGESGSTAHTLVTQTADRVHTVAGYLDGKQPGELVSDVQALGRRRPGMFLLGAALAGVAVGRLASAARKASNDSPSPTGSDVPAAPLTAPPVIAEPVPPIRSTPVGAATIEPYPEAGTTPSAGTL